mmetsp:Transcript_42372/g.65040  ORF Transcript_42372/g.65040 Transcript_42372/m.65040 type:complete len:240 (+) Transcript_42372:470-1189(+)
MDGVGLVGGVVEPGGTVGPGVVSIADALAVVLRHAIARAVEHEDLHVLRGPARRVIGCGHSVDLADELLVGGEVIEVSLGSFVVVGGDEVARFGGYNKSEVVVALVVATNHVLGSRPVEIEDPAVLSPEALVGRDNKFEPQGLVDTSIVEVVLSSGNDHGVVGVLVQDLSVDVGVINHIVISVGLADLRREALVDGALRALVHVDGGVELLRFVAHSQHVEVGRLHLVPVGLKQLSVVA